jgi:SAM-dependent methyltransferase
MDGSTARRESAFFAAYVREHGRFNPFHDRGWATLARRFHEAVAELPAGGRLLDVGCGTGESRRIYAEWTRRYTGLDLSFGGLVVAHAGADASSWLAADGTSIPFPDASFDVVAFSSVLHHMPDMVGALREARRVLRGGGRIFAYDPNLRHPAMWLFRNPASPFYRPEGVSPDERPLRAEELRHAFAEAGLTVTAQRAQSDIPYRHVAISGFQLGLVLFNAFDSAWEHLGLGRRLGTFLVTAAIR